jgi:hypothetical protein
MLHTCPKCKEGKTTLTISYFGSKESEKVEIDCVYCDGSGKITQETLSDINFEDDMWCTCDTDHGTKYYSDGQHPEIHKHHWRCKGCGDVKQIG